MMVGFLLVMGALWGLQFAMLKMAAEAGYQEISVLMISLLLLSLAFLGLSKIKGEGRVLRRDWIPFLIVTALMGYVIPLGMIP